MKKPHTINRKVWKTSYELKDEFRYTDCSCINKIVKENKIPTVQNPDSSVPHAILINREEIIKTSKIINRLLDNQDMERYDQELCLRGDYMIFGDVHIPYHDGQLIGKKMAVAKKFKIKKAVCVGDFVELDAFKVYFDKTASWKYEKAKVRDVLKALLSWYNEFIWLIGNHEVRMWKRLQGMGEQEDIFQLLLSAETKGRVKYSTYPYAIINDSWIIAHPKSYSRIQGRNAFFLASKYMPSLVAKSKSPNGQYGFLSFHGHGGGEGIDVSGICQIADGMGLMDPLKIAYKTIKMDTSPEWRPGFSMLKDNYLYRFPKNSTDWDFWLK